MCMNVFVLLVCFVLFVGELLFVDLEDLILFDGEIGSVMRLEVKDLDVVWEVWYVWVILIVDVYDVVIEFLFEFVLWLSDWVGV